MTTTDVFNLWLDVDLRARIEELANSFTRNPEYRKVLRVKAWIAIGDALDGKVNQYYIAVAYSTMRRYYQTYQMEKPKRWVSDDAGIRRANERIKRYGINRG